MSDLKSPILSRPRLERRASEVKSPTASASQLLALMWVGIVIYTAGACRDPAHLSPVPRSPAPSACECPPAPQTDGGPLEIGSPDAPAPGYDPRPDLDAAAPDGPPDTGGVPCLRWAPDGGTCWFLSGEPEQVIDQWCEDSVDAGSEWCECLGLDWQAEQGRARAVMGAFRYCPAP